MAGKLIWRGDEVEGKVTEAAKAAVDETLEASAKAARSRAPVDTGALKSSIIVESSGELSGRFGAAVPYAIFVELGTRNAPAQPFLRPAADAENKKLAAHIKARLK